MIHLRYRTDSLLLIFFLFQIGFWWIIKDIQPELQVVPEIPGPTAVKALSFGDEEFYFMVMALELQNLGDTYGRFTALKYYNYKKLSDWWAMMDMLDDQSNFVPSLASYYFSQTQNKPDVRYVVDYLEKHSLAEPGRNWWWLSQATYLANHIIGDKERALEISYKLANAKGNDIPIWAREMPAFIHEELNEDDEALVIIENLRKNEKNLSQKEINFMNYFVADRLHKIIADQKK